MCGRFARYQVIQALLAVLRESLPNLDTSNVPDLQASYNVAPSQTVLTIGRSRPENPHKFALLHWGFIPSWTDDLKKAIKPINAKCETLHESRIFKKAFNGQRCLIVGDGFYEWKKTGKLKQPFYFCLKNDLPLAFGGIWDACRINGGLIVSCAIITTPSNELIKPVHDRMPLILHPKDYALWCDPEKTAAAVAHLLTPFPAEEMRTFAVSDRVNKPMFDDAGLIEPI